MENDKNAELYQAADGARFTRYSELKAYLESVFTPELAAQYASGGYNAQYGYHTGYMAGEKDELRFGGGERGTNPLILAQLCTEPQTQPDGQSGVRPSGHRVCRGRPAQGHPLPGQYGIPSD